MPAQTHTPNLLGTIAAPKPTTDLEPCDLLNCIGNRHSLFILHAGQTYAVDVEIDDDADAPWDNSDGHGKVSCWTTREPEPGELTLSKDRNSYRYYDFAGAVDRALAERWNSCTTREEAAEAARQDYAHLKAWCDDEWHYLRVSVAWYTPAGRQMRQSLSGIEGTDDGKYLLEVLRDLLAEAEAERTQAGLQICPTCQGRGICTSTVPTAPGGSTPTWTPDAHNEKHTHSSGRWRVDLHMKNPRTFCIYRIDEDGNATYAGQATNLREAKREVERRHTLDVHRTTTAQQEPQEARSLPEAGALDAVATVLAEANQAADRPERLAEILDRIDQIIQRTGRPTA